MMYKWPNIPSERASAHEIADFVELSAWRDRSASIVSISRDIARIAEIDYSSGVPEDDEEGVMGQKLHDAYFEIEKRLISCGKTRGYPFKVENPESTLRMHFRDSCNQHIVYQYLLLVTRLSKGGNHRFESISGADLFEELCAQIARSYLGNRAESLVFGTASGGSFRGKVLDLTQRIGEGRGAKKEISSSTRDGKLDVVAWKPFADQIDGKLILFAQCKTGTGYRDSVTQLRPQEFCQKYMLKQPAVIPMRAFFVSEALPRTGARNRVKWYEMATDSGLFFDRCRIIDYCESLESNTVERIRKWTDAAAGKFLHHRLIKNMHEGTHSETRKSLLLN